MFKTLDRYLFFECLPTLALSVTVFTFVLLMQRSLTKGLTFGAVKG